MQVESGDNLNFQTQETTAFVFDFTSQIEEFDRDLSNISTQLNLVSPNNINGTLGNHDSKDNEVTIIDLEEPVEIFEFDFEGNID